MSRISRKLRGAVVVSTMLAATTVGLAATSGPASAAGGHDGATEEICHAAGLYLRSKPWPDGPAIDHLENHWHFVVSYHAANGMLYGYSPRLNRSGYVIDGYFC
jgi:hypothetical protein